MIDEKSGKSMILPTLMTEECIITTTKTTTTTTTSVNVDETNTVQHVQQQESNYNDHHDDMKQQQEDITIMIIISTLHQMENYGMGYTSSSFATLPNLTKLLLEQQLKPYYSPNWQNSEESYYEIFSFVAIQSLLPFINYLPNHNHNHNNDHNNKNNDDEKQKTSSLTSWSCQHCTNTIERMEHAYHIMQQHILWLKIAAQQMNQDLHDCGEECMDLW